jgi:hypothetical protein
MLYRPHGETCCLHPLLKIEKGSSRCVYTRQRISEVRNHNTHRTDISRKKLLAVTDIEGAYRFYKSLRAKAVQSSRSLIFIFSLAHVHCNIITPSNL